MFKNIDWNSVYSITFTVGALLTAMGYVARHMIKGQTEELKNDLAKITYALYNDGKTGLINKVDLLLEHQQQIIVDVEVLKSKRSPRS